MQTLREAALRPEAVEQYPYLPARIWTAARRLTDLVTRYGAPKVKAAGGRYRLLSERHFMFRGGEFRSGEPAS
jgi:hypothetical protein